MQFNNPRNNLGLCWLPSSKLIIILENADYIAMLKERLVEIKRFYGNLKLAPLAGRR